jgi:hypothetical protein
LGDAAVTVPAAIVVVCAYYLTPPRADPESDFGFDEDRRAGLDRVIPSIRLESATLAEALEALGRSTGARIEPDVRALEAVGIDPNQVRATLQLDRVTLAQSLDVICHLASRRINIQLDFYSEDGVVRVTTADDCASRTVVRVYDVRDLIDRAMSDRELFDSIMFTHDFSLAPGTAHNLRLDASARVAPSERVIAQGLCDSMMTVVDPTSWRDAGGSIGHIRVADGRLVVCQSRRAHRQIERLLNDLRACGTPLFFYTVVQ